MGRGTPPLLRAAVALAATASAALLAVGAGAAEPVASPASAEDAGQRAVLQKVCGRCHSVEVVLDSAKSQTEWRDTIQTMVDRGAQATDDEFDAIVAYLDTHVTTINVNSAGPDELEDVLDVPAKVSDAIVSRRRARPFKDLADLETLPGVDARALEARRKLIFF